MEGKFALIISIHRNLDIKTMEITPTKDIMRMILLFSEKMLEPMEGMSLEVSIKLVENFILKPKILVE